LRGLFLCFEFVLSLKINLAKSELVPVGLINNIEGLARILGWRVLPLPMKYLGLPLGASFKAKPIWNGIIEKVEHCLAGWKQLYLSKGGRITLMKYLGLPLGASFKAKPIWNAIIEKAEHCLAGWKWLYSSKGGKITLIKALCLICLPISCRCFPSRLVSPIELISCSGISCWGGMGEEVKFHMVRWPKVCSPINEGGLRVRNLHMFNRALGSGYGVTHLREKLYGEG
jgi:hypothetical protein